MFPKHLTNSRFFKNILNNYKNNSVFFLLIKSIIDRMFKN